MPEDAVKFDPPIEIDLGDNPGPVTFRTYGQVRKWAERERDAWAVLQDPAMTQHLIVRVRRQKSAGADLIELLNGQREQIEKLLNRYRERDLIHSTSAAGQRLISLAGSSPSLVAAGLWAQMQWHREQSGARGPAWMHENDFVIWGGLLAGELGRVSSGVDRVDPKARQAAASAVDRQLVEYESDWRKRLADAAETDVANQVTFDKARKEQAQEFRELVSASQGSNDAFIAEAKRQIADLETLFREKIQLEAPVAYWRAKVASHRRGVRLWGAILAITTLGPLLTIAYYGPALLKQFMEVQGTLTTAGLALLLALAVLYLAFGRIVSRLFSTSLALRDDAAERVVMAETFLALVHDKKLTDEERKLVLAPLFRPHGASSDAEGISGLLDAISKAMTSK